MSDRPLEYIRFLDGDNNPTFSTTWTLTDPGLTVWGPSVTTAGVVSMTSGAVAGTTPIIMGLDGYNWVPTIATTGIISITRGTTLSTSDTAAAILDSNGVQWVLYVDLSQQVNVTTAQGLPSLFRYPSVIVTWTPAASTDSLIIYSLRVPATIRRKGA